MGKESLSWEYYSRQRQEWYHPENVLRRLNYVLGLKHFSESIQIDETPFLKRFFKEKHEALSSGADLEPEEMWRRRVALLGLVCDRWESRKLPVPPDWIEGIGFAKKEYTLSMVPELSPYSSALWDWEKKFNDPRNEYVKPGKENPWTLREDLAADFCERYFGKAREIIAAITKAGVTAEETLKLHRALRDHVDEVSWYDRNRLREAIRLKLPAFSSEFAASTDPAVKFAITALNEICTYRAEPSINVCKILLSSYWDRLKEISKGAEAKKLIDLIQFEVTEVIEAQEAIAQGGGK